MAIFMPHAPNYQLKHLTGALDLVSLSPVAYVAAVVG